METVAYRLPSRLEALAAAHMLRARGHSADLPLSPVADDATTLVIRTSRDALAHVLAMVEGMFPTAQRCPDPPTAKRSDDLR